MDQEYEVWYVDGANGETHLGTVCVGENLSGRRFVGIQVLREDADELEAAWYRTNMMRNLCVDGEVFH